MGRIDEFRKRMESRMAALGGTGEGGGGTGRGADLEAIARYLTPTEDEMLQWWEAVARSPHVRENARYAAAAAATRLGYLPGNDGVNAFARTAQDGKGFEIVFYGGAVRFSRLAAMAVAQDLCGRKGTAARFARAMEDFAGSLPAKLASEVLVECGLDEGFGAPGVAGKAQAVSAGMFIGVLGHEMGHVCLGHVEGPNYYAANQEVSRNHEREADSFASSVTAMTPFGECLYEGTLFWHAVLAMQQGAEAAESTHPLERERLENLIRANPSKASALGIRLPAG